MELSLTAKLPSWPLISFILLFGSIAMSGFSHAQALQSGQPTAMKPPNIVLLFSDDAGYADFGFTGSAEIKTPNLDALARRGVIFTSAYVSDPTCGPSRAGLLTGQYQQKFGYHENNVPGYMSPASKLLGDDMGLPVDQLTMGDYLQQAGYKTALFGKWHLGGADQYHPTVRGFDTFYGFRGGRRSYWAHDDTNPAADSLDLMERGFGNFQEHEGYLTDVLADETIDFIKASQNQPFFALVSFNAPHTPLNATEDDLAQFPELSGDRKTYAAMMLAMDRASGAILDTLDELGLAENTIVVFTNDNGGPTDQNSGSNLPYAGTKSNHLEGGIRVPYVLRWPARIEGGQTFDDPVSTLDLLPTFIAAARPDAPLPDAVDGVDLIPFVTGGADNKPHDYLFWKKDTRAAVLHGDWKLIRYGDRPAELFNLAVDPAEQNDLSSVNPELTKDLFHKIYEWELGLERPLWMLKQEYEKFDVDRMDAYRVPQMKQ